uniref:NADH-ubiquinone oxidoreductase chain 3 n=1 Tax=Seasogonia rosea TaxID=3004257 RepID=A0A9E9JJ43_9HEMI|nr:NADH dehydrogenase subunit 3 [Seasogonia rosea]WAP91742.1 NADH dehydrogenase subunit 3 [Seasogonia rosea]
MNKSFIFMLMVIMLIMLICSLISIVSKKSIIDFQKSSPFECGFNPMSHKRLPFSVHFFLIAVIFLIFDIEIIIIVPLITTMKSTLMMYWFMTALLFIMILIMGLFYEWHNGLLNWTN